MVGTLVQVLLHVGEMLADLRHEGRVDLEQRTPLVKDRRLLVDLQLLGLVGGTLVVPVVPGVLMDLGKQELSQRQAEFHSVLGLALLLGTLLLPLDLRTELGTVAELLDEKLAFLFNSGSLGLVGVHSETLELLADL